LRYIKFFFNFPKISQNSNLSFSQSNYFIDISIDLSIFPFFAISSSPGRGTSRPLGGAETAAALAADFGAGGAAARPGGGAAAATALRGQAAGGAAWTLWDRVWRCFGGPGMVIFGRTSLYI